jgi:hypothetical protein
MTNKYRTPNDGIELVKKSAQEFDTHKIYHIKAGKKINNYDFIQENNVDTDIYQTLEKYGTLKPMEVNIPEIYGEFEEMDLRDFYNFQEKANKMWLNLPLEVRKEFDNDKTRFMQEGKSWIEKKYKEHQKQNEQTIEQPKEEVEQNEQK